MTIEEIRLRYKLKKLGYICRFKKLMRRLRKARVRREEQLELRI